MAQASAIKRPAIFHQKQTLAARYRHTVSRNAKHFEARLLKPDDCTSNTTVRSFAVRIDQRSFAGGSRNCTEVGVCGDHDSVNSDGAGMAFAYRAHVYRWPFGTGGGGN
jgi:hypothetical protein